MKFSNGLRVAYTISVLVGLFLVFSGVLLLFFKPMADVVFGVSGSSSLASQSLSSAVGIRQLVIGLVIVALSVLRERKSLGVVLVIGWLVPLFDFLDYSPLIGMVSALRHGVTVPVVLITGIALLRLKDAKGKAVE